MEKIIGVHKNKKTGRYVAMQLNNDINMRAKKGKIKIMPKVEEVKEVKVVRSVVVGQVEQVKPVEILIKKNRKHKK